MMNDQKPYPTERSDMSPYVTFALGALVGAGIALLLAPATGERTRRRLGATAQRWGSDASKSFGEMRDRVTDRIDDVASHVGADAKSALDAGLDAMRQDGEGTPPTGGPRIPRAFEPSNPRSL